ARGVVSERGPWGPRCVRLAAARHGLRIEASWRFERGVDREGLRRAADRAAHLLAELAGGEAAPGALEAVGNPPAATASVRLEVARANRLLGTGLSAAHIRGGLQPAGVAC